MLLASLKTPNRVLAHLVPLGTPPALMPFIVIIELRRRVIRPLTLSVRLAANIIAGHLLLSLLARRGPSMPVISLSCMMRALILLCILECAVSIIQAYVFRVLATLYLNEVNSPQVA
jgi:F-type H+-transporting ATPase subunit a